MARRRKTKKAQSSQVKHLIKSVMRFEEHLLLEHGNLVRIIILLVAAIYAGLVLVPHSQEFSVQPHHSSAIDAATIAALQNEIAKKAANRDAVPHVNPQAFFQPTPKPTPTLTPEPSPSQNTETPSPGPTESPADPLL